MSQLRATYLRTQTSQFMPITLRTNPTMTIDRTFHKTVSRRDDKKMREKLDDEDRILDSILTSSLEEVLTYGWSLTAVEAAVKKLGCMDDDLPMLGHRVTVKGAHCCAVCSWQGIDLTYYQCQKDTLFQMFFASLD